MLLKYIYCNELHHVYIYLLIVDIFLILSGFRRVCADYRHHQQTQVFHWNTILVRSLYLTHWGRVTHICVGKLTIIGSDNGLSPGRRQAIIWTNTEILLIRPLRTNLSEILVEFHIFSIKKMHLKMSSAKWRSFCLGLNVLMHWSYVCLFLHLTIEMGMLTFPTSSMKANNELAKM